MRDTPRYGTGLTNVILWYDKPAGLYTEALPIGTGHLAAMVFCSRAVIGSSIRRMWCGE